MNESRCAFQIGAGAVAFPVDWIVGVYPLVNPSVAGEFIPVDQLRGALLGEGELRLVAIPELPDLRGRFVLVLREGDRRVGVRIDQILTGPAPESAFVPVRSALFRETDVRPPSVTTQKENSRSSTYLVGETDLGLIALDIHDVVEIVHAREIKKRRLVHERTVGYLNHRGPAVPVLALADSPTDASDPSLVILQAEGMNFAIPVHRLHALVHEPQWEGRSARVWNPLETLPAAELREIRRGYDRIFPDQSDVQLVRARGEERTYLEFDLVDAAMIPLDAVLSLEELALLPTRAAPPGGLGFQTVHGMDVPVFDGRALYGLPALATATGRERVVVLRNGEHPFGVVVDGISDIRRVDAASRMDFPRLMLATFPQLYQNDVTDFFQVLDTRHENVLNMKVCGFTHLAAKVRGA